MKPILPLLIIALWGCNSNYNQVTHEPKFENFEQEYFVTISEFDITDTIKTQTSSAVYKVRATCTDNTPLIINWTQFFPLPNTDQKESQNLENTVNFRKGLNIVYEIDSLGQIKDFLNSYELKLWVDSVFHQDLNNKGLDSIEQSRIENYKSTFLTEELITLKNTRVVQALHLVLDTTLKEAPDINGYDSEMFAGNLYYKTIFESDSLLKKLVIHKHQVDDYNYFMNIEEHPQILDSSYVTIDLNSGLPIEVNTKRTASIGNRTKEIRIFIKTASNIK